jgi:PAS domain S-box-containing protein
MANRAVQRFNAFLWCAFGALLACVVSFVFHAKAEIDLRVAFDLRTRSLLLANELRQSSDDLTRMMRTYVVTGDRIYSEHFQEILDIRDGRKPRPVDYENVYWDLVLEDERPTAMGAAAALFERMRALGFTELELARLADAKKRSDALVDIERAAMRFADALVDAPASEASLAKRLSAVQMLHDANYHRAKADIMKPIADFRRMVSERTAGLVASAERQATITLVTFIASGGLLLILLYLLQRSFRRMIGGSVSLLHEAVTQAAKGDFPALPTGMAPKDTILGKLAEAGQNRTPHDVRRTESELALSEAERHFLDVVARSGESICVVQDAIVRFVNAKLLTVLGYSEHDMIGRPFIELVDADDRVALLDRYRKRLEGSLYGVKSVFRVREKDGAMHTVESHAAKCEWAGRPATLYFLNEVAVAYVASTG